MTHRNPKGQRHRAGMSLLLILLLAAPVTAAAAGGKKRRGQQSAAAQQAAPTEERIAADATPAAVVPEAAAADLARGQELYAAGEYTAALPALQAAEDAGARGGLLYYQIGYCHRALGDAAANREAKRKALPYLEAEVAAGPDSADPFYYLAAASYQDLGEPERGDAAVRQGLEAVHRGVIPPPADGTAWFRLGRLYGFALGRGVPVDGLDPQGLASGRLEAYRRTAETLGAEPGNRVYLLLALGDLAEAAAEAGNVREAITLYGRASALDPLQETPGSMLWGIGVEAQARGDLELALEAWRAIRGPDGPKTRAQYAIRITEKTLAYGELPVAFEGRPLAELDRETLERGALEAAAVLRADAVAGDAAGADRPDPEEVRRQRGIFLALLTTYQARGFDLRAFVVGNQLIPLIFR